MNEEKAPVTGRTRNYFKPARRHKKYQLGMTDMVDIQAPTGHRPRHRVSRSFADAGWCAQSSHAATCALPTLRRSASFDDAHALPMSHASSTTWLTSLLYTNVEEGSLASLSSEAESTATNARPEHCDRRNICIADDRVELPSPAATESSSSKLETKTNDNVTSAAPSVQWFAPRPTEISTVFSDLVTSQALNNMKQRPSSGTNRDIRRSLSNKIETSGARSPPSNTVASPLDLHQAIAQQDAFYAWDMYSLGIVIWSLLQHALPWHECNTKEIARLVTAGLRPAYTAATRQEPLVMRTEITTDREQNSALSSELKKISQQCWLTSPVLRPRPEDVLSALAPER